MAIGVGAAIVIAGGVSAYFATRPPERIVETVIQERTVERTMVETIGGKEVTRMVVETLSVSPSVRLTVPVKGWKINTSTSGSMP